MISLWRKLWHNGYMNVEDKINDPFKRSFRMWSVPPSLLFSVIMELIRFWRRRWQWIITTIIGAIIMVVTVLKYIHGQP